MSTPASHPPYPKWVYDIVIEAIWQQQQGGTINPGDLLRFTPSAMQIACRGIIDYHTFTGPVSDGSANPSVPAAAPAPEPPAAAAAPTGTSDPDGTQVMPLAVAAHAGIL